MIWSLFSQGGLSLVSRDVKRQIHSPSNTSGPTHSPVIRSNFPTHFFFPTNFFGMTWVHIKIHKFIIYSFSFRFSGNFGDILIIYFSYQLILNNLYLWGKVTLRQTPLGENDNFLLKKSMDVIDISEWLDIKLYLNYTRSNT